MFERRLRQRHPDRDARARRPRSGSASTPIYCSPRTRSRGCYPVPLEGNGLNPLLQDPGLAFHPPTLYFGYVGISIAFSFAVGALITRDVGPAFARAMRPWVLGAWIFLTLGITAGSYWAYYELGWGGWWFWDPVENASLMPWLAATALLHSVTVLATRAGLRAWTIMLAVVAFSMSMIGTFLVRSGILTSVHAFAVDPLRGAFILALLAFYIGGALMLFGLRVRYVREGSTFEIVSREASLVINNLLLSVILGIVFIGTLYPLVTQAFGREISVGPPYFNTAIGPIALVLAAIMTIGPMLRWRRDDLRERLAAGRRSRCCSAPRCSLLVVILAPGIHWLPLLGLADRARRRASPASRRSGAATCAARRSSLYGMVDRPSRHRRRARRHGVRTAPSSRRPWSRPSPGQTIEAPGRSNPLHRVAADHRSQLDRGRGAARGAARRRRAVPAVLRRRACSIRRRRRPARPSIQTLWDGQLYVAVGDRPTDIRAAGSCASWWKPFVTLIWAGGAMVAFGGFLALIGRCAVRRERRTKPGGGARGGAGMKT